MWRSLAVELARMPDVVQRILAAHHRRPDGFCAACTNGGTGTHHTRWPCPLSELAQLAADIVCERGRPQ